MSNLQTEKNMSPWTSPPEIAWREHILPHAADPRWIENSKNISTEIDLSKRELFALIILAHWYNNDPDDWLVGYDASDEQPNDGYITNGVSKLRIEHKVIPQMEPTEVLEAILSTYQETAKQGPGYGKDRVLVIQPNKPSDHGGLIKISDLTREIGDQCPFDQVLTLAMVKRGEDNRTGVMHIIEHYPPKSGDPYSGKGIVEVVFDFVTGQATVAHSGIEYSV